MKTAGITTLFMVLLALFSVFPVSAFAEDESDTYIDYILGDVDLNGKITASDARLALRYSAKLETFDDIRLLAADYNTDGRVTAYDARCILKVSAGLDPYETVTTPTVTSKVIDVSVMGQYPDFPSGCESVAAVMNLNYYGIDVTVGQFVDGYLSTGIAPSANNGIWYSSDPNETFLGDPRSSDGWGIWAKGLEKAINKCLDNYLGNYTVTVTYSETLDSLCEKYIANNIPVLVWVTADMAEPYKNITAYVIGTDRTFTWISPSHCMLLVGYDETGYYFNDPITGKREKYSKSASDTAFKGNGSQAVVIEKH